MPRMTVASFRPARSNKVTSSSFPLPPRNRPRNRRPSTSRVRCWDCEPQRQVKCRDSPRAGTCTLALGATAGSAHLSVAVTSPLTVGCRGSHLQSVSAAGCQPCNHLSMDCAWDRTTSPRPNLGFVCYHLPRSSCSRVPLVPTLGPSGYNVRISPFEDAERCRRSGRPKLKWANVSEGA